MSAFDQLANVEGPVFQVSIVIFGGICLVAAFKVLFGGSKKKELIALDAEKLIEFKLSEKIVVSHDTRILRFALQTPEHTLGLPIGQHMYLKANIDGNDVQRAYTPISSDDDKGHFDLLVKVYFKNVHPKFPEGGKMSQYLESMTPGTSIAVRGPSGRFVYEGCGVYKTRHGQVWTHRKTKKMAMIAGGSGLTPLLQIINAVLKNPEDNTEMTLLYANQTEEDILLRDQLEVAAKDPRLTIWYTLDRPATDGSWKYSTGFIDEAMLGEHLPAAGGSSADTVVLMCGPPPMINFACKPNLLKLKFTDDQFYTF